MMVNPISVIFRVIGATGRRDPIARRCYCSPDDDAIVIAAMANLAAIPLIVQQPQILSDPSSLVSTFLSASAME
jgi:hypothetical protein